MTFTLPDLPFERDALEPVISKETISFHYDKHHNAYVTNLNNLIPNTPYEGKSLEEIVKTSSDGIFNNAAQVFNHTFYWQCLTSPKSSRDPEGALLAAIEKTFKTFAAFKDEFTAKAVGNFGSGWTWLVKNGAGELSIVNTSNAGTVITEEGLTPLLVIDVWEHAYYVDYRNARPNYVAKFWEIVNWEFAEKQFAS